MLGVKSYAIYGLVIAFSLLFAWLSERNREAPAGGPHPSRVNQKWFFLAFLIPCIMITFTDSGVDYYHYIDLIQRYQDTPLTDIWSVGGVEPMFVLFSQIVLFFFHNPHMVLFFLKLFAICGYFYAIYFFSDRISVFFAVFAYFAILFPGSFYIIRQNFSCSMFCLCLCEMQGRRRRWLEVIYLILAATIHYTASVFVLIWLYDVLLSKSRKSRKWLIVAAVAAIVLVYLRFQDVMNLLSGFWLLDNYAGYTDSVSEYEGSGILQVVYYLPIFFIWWQYVRKKANDLFLEELVILSAMNFAFAQLGYLFSAFIRMSYYSMAAFCILLPMLSFDAGARPDQMGLLTFRIHLKGRDVTKLLVGAAMLLYLGFRMYMNYAKLLAYGNDSQLYWYHFIVPFFYQ